MSKQPKVPPMAAQPAPEQPQQVQIVGVPLNGVPVNINRAPDGQVHLVLGPLFLILPLEPGMAKQVAEAMKAASSGVLVAQSVLGGI